VFEIKEKKRKETHITTFKRTAKIITFIIFQCFEVSCRSTLRIPRTCNTFSKKVEMRIDSAMIGFGRKQQAL
jgi:hypothetical protein